MKHCISCLIYYFKHRKVVYQTREGVLHPISNHREVEYQTLEGVFHLVMQTPRKRLKIQDTAECNKAKLNF